MCSKPTGSSTVSDDTVKVRFVTEEQQQIEMLQKEVVHLQEALFVFMAFVQRLADNTGHFDLGDSIELGYIREHIAQGDKEKLEELIRVARAFV